MAKPKVSEALTERDVARAVAGRCCSCSGRLVARGCIGIRRRDIKRGAADRAVRGRIGRTQRQGQSGTGTPTIKE